MKGTKRTAAAKLVCEKQMREKKAPWRVYFVLLHVPPTNQTNQSVGQSESITAKGSVSSLVVNLFRKNSKGVHLSFGVVLIDGRLRCSAPAPVL